MAWVQLLLILTSQTPPDFNEISLGEEMPLYQQRHGVLCALKQEDKLWIGAAFNNSAALPEGKPSNRRQSRQSETGHGHKTSEMEPLSEAPCYTHEGLTPILRCHQAGGSTEQV